MEGLDAAGMALLSCNENWGGTISTCSVDIATQLVQDLDAAGMTILSRNADGGGTISL